MKTTFEINKKNYDGFIKYIYKINLNKYLILFILFGLSTIIFFSKIIFSIDIITNDNKMKQLIMEELKKNGLKVYSFKKKYEKIQKIKKNIKEKYKNEIDWIEIENIGTKYIVRYEPRLNNPIIKKNNFRHIVAKKDCIIYSLDINNGQIIKQKNDYVKKGDIIVSGDIYLNNEIKNKVSSNGHVYGEVWYIVTVSYPLNYKEEILTGKKNNVYVIKFLNKKIELFNFKKFKNKKINSKIIIRNNILPFSIEKEYQKEINVKKENNTNEEALKKAKDLATKKIEEKLNKNEFILNKKILGGFNDNNNVTVKIFFSVVEDITDYLEIDEYQDNNDEINN